MGKFFEDFKTNKLAALIDSCLYETNKYVKVHNIHIMKRFVLMIMAFSHTMLDTLALQYSGVNLK